VIQFQAELLLGQAFFQAVQLDLDNMRELLLVEAMENDDVIHAIEELGPEVRAQFGPNQALHFGVLFGS